MSEDKKGFVDRSSDASDAKHMAVSCTRLDRCIRCIRPSINLKCPDQTQQQRLTYAHSRVSRCHHSLEQHMWRSRPDTLTERPDSLTKIDVCSQSCLTKAKCHDSLEPKAESPPSEVGVPLVATELPEEPLLAKMLSPSSVAVQMKHNSECAVRPPLAKMLSPSAVAAQMNYNSGECAVGWKPVFWEGRHTRVAVDPVF